MDKAANIRNMSVIAHGESGSKRAGRSRLAIILTSAVHHQSTTASPR